MSHLSAFSELVALAERSQQLALELPAKENAQTHWNGLGFSLLGQQFVAPMSEVAELLRVPTTTRLPGVKHFVLGIANVRGKLMAILDLAAFFESENVKSLSRSQRRVLGVEDDEQFFGFIVDESLGMRHFPRDAFSDEVAVQEMFKPFVRGGYEMSGAVWPVLSLASLAADSKLKDLSQST